MPRDTGAFIARWRLRNQQIDRQRFAQPEDIVHWFGAMQAQEYEAALWALGLRTKGVSTRTSVQRALAEGRIVRTWPLRGTLHFVAPNDVRWMLQLLAPRVLAAAASRLRALELDAALLARAERACRRALEADAVLTRSALYTALERARIATGNSRGMHIVWYLAHRGVVCHGPRAGNQPTVVLLDAWVPNARMLDRTDALSELATRYVTSHGPAQAQDFAWWAGLTLRDARAGLDGATAGGRLQRESFGGKMYWFSDAAPALRRSQPSAAYLLPVFDEFTVAYRDRGAVLDARHARKVNAGGGLIRPVIVIDGQVVGTWQRSLRRAGGVTVVPTALTRFAAGQREAIRIAAVRYARFVERPLVDA